jgi:hypothetical protein
MRTRRGRLGMSVCDLALPASLTYDALSDVKTVRATFLTGWVGRQRIRWPVDT